MRTLNGHELYTIKGGSLSFKITTDIDLFIAEQIAIRSGVFAKDLKKVKV